MVMSIDFIGGRSQMGGAGGAMLVAAPAMAATEVAGVKPAARWNGAANIMGTLPPGARRRDGDHRERDVEFAQHGQQSGRVAGGLRRHAGQHAHDERLPRSGGRLDARGGDGQRLAASITGGGYDVYVYVTGELGTGMSTRMYNYAIGTAMFTVSQTGPTPTSFTSFTLAPAGGAGNYIVFRNLTAATFTLTATPGTGNATRAP